MDAEKTELVRSLLSQLEVLGQAAGRVSTAAELLGSVQQEWRLAESFKLMVSHLRNLKKQRDNARLQLQDYIKYVTVTGIVLVVMVTPHAMVTQLVIVLEARNG